MTSIAQAWGAWSSNPRLRAALRVAWAAFVTLCALATVVLAILYGVKQADEAKKHRKEAATVHLACERSRVFGPPFISFLEGTERKLGLNALSLEVKVGDKTESVLGFYRSTIPKSCPPGPRP